MDEARPEIGVGVGPRQPLAGRGRLLARVAAVGLALRRPKPLNGGCVARTLEALLAEVGLDPGEAARLQAALAGSVPGVGDEIRIGGLAQPQLRAAQGRLPTGQAAPRAS